MQKPPMQTENKRRERGEKKMYGRGERKRDEAIEGR